MVQDAISLRRNKVSSLVRCQQTPHLPWSGQIEIDDIITNDTSNWESRKIVVTEKIDGEHIVVGKHSWGLQYRLTDEERDYGLAECIRRIQTLLPEGVILHGEYTKIQHSVLYTNKRSDLLFFSVVQDGQYLNWQNTKDFFEKMGIISVPTLYEGIWNSEVLRDLASKCDRNINTEGYVVRVFDSFPENDFSKCVAKYVKKGFKQVKIRD